MKTLVDQLATYAAYHRDRRNIATHFVGIPLIVLGLDVLLARASADVVGVPVNGAVVLSLLAGAYYFRLDLRYGLVMAAVSAAFVAVALDVAQWATGPWLAAGLGAFVVGWVFQGVGHHWEGRKPAFVDDLMGLVIGPLFVAAEAGFAMGLRRDVEARITERAGPVRAARPVGAAR